MENKETVLITGASSGIGLELAKVFAFHKFDLILVSRSIEKLKELASILKNDYEVNVQVIEYDLSKSGAAKGIFNKVKSMNLQVDMLINNAGTGIVGFFHEIEESKDLEIMQLNMITLTEMTKLFSREMIKRKRGKILNVASTGAFSPGPFTAVYYASKAYVLSFSEALSIELGQYNITVTALCPGATRTNYSKNAGKKDMPNAMNPRRVALAAYEGLINNKKIVVPGIANKILIRLPKRLVSKINFKTQKKLSISKR
ncbi:SDR family NAD(P)-dependent oxidoreductase [Clostridium chromiireducens]|uniref:SDR family NAD(P)-dependent oxidoreductase n=1 Tax=Clostridium chromiireducens TaxID=225345 RepID=A0A964RNN7_9CLOT|nr:SDR family oxidoreductase [Clostridium chromiireducens]MVX64738.1 SDR family NAD(P)-dependent oxidoreductase [Clostridium chromiireducens]